MRLAQGHAEEAETLITCAINVAQANGDRYLEAYAWRALGRVYQRLGQSALHHAFATAIVLFEALELPQEVAATQSLLPGRE